MSTELRDQIAQALAEHFATRMDQIRAEAQITGRTHGIELPDASPEPVVPENWTGEADIAVGFIAAELHRLHREFQHAVAEEGLDAFTLTELLGDRAAYLTPETTPETEEGP